MRLLGSFGLLTVLGTATALYADDATLRSQSNAMMERANSVARDVALLQGRARAQRDVIKLNCVNSKLIEIKAQLNIADSENVSLQVAIADHQDTAAAVQSLKSTLESLDRLHSEARLCVGVTELGTRGTTATHPTFLDEPTPVEMPFDGSFGNPIEPPAYASPII